jgi:hypothetical protein
MNVIQTLLRLAKEKWPVEPGDRAHAVTVPSDGNGILLTLNRDGRFHSFTISDNELATKTPEGMVNEIEQLIVEQADARGSIMHPMQPVVLTRDGIIRFKANEVVTALFNHAQNTGLNMCDMRLRFTQCNNEDWSQFAQLIGYSVSGYGDLSYADDEIIHWADKCANEILKNGQT